MHTHRAKRPVGVIIFIFTIFPFEAVVPMVSYCATPHPRLPTSLPCVCTVCQSRCAMQGPSPPTHSWAIRPPANANWTRAHENGIFAWIRLGCAHLCQAEDRLKFRFDVRAEVLLLKICWTRGFFPSTNKRRQIAPFARVSWARVILASSSHAWHEWRVGEFWPVGKGYSLPGLPPNSGGGGFVCIHFQLILNWCSFKPNRLVEKKGEGSLWFLRLPPRDDSSGLRRRPAYLLQ